MASALTRIDKLLHQVLVEIPDPAKGLPEPVFEFALKITPMINVDLLVRNDEGCQLLAWREDEWGKGWHIPGGIIRYNERIADRIDAVASMELTARVRCEARPADVRQCFHARGHFISLLYVCSLEEPVRDQFLFHEIGTPRQGQLKWIQGVPPDLYGMHKMYSDWLAGDRR